MEQVESVVIGAGACGLMCAVQAGFLGKQVLVLEKNDKAGAKILISGGGHCNYTNLYAGPANFLSGNEHFCKSTLAQWTVDDTVTFFETYGINGAEKTLGQLFPVSNKAKDVVNVFTQLCNDLGQEIRYEAEVRGVEQVADGGGFKVAYLQNGRERILSARNVVMASGGLPIPKMGASDLSLKVASRMGLALTQTWPALVPLTITGKDEEWFASLSGNSVYARVSNEKISFDENILFTHWGLSGPAILQISSYWRPGEWISIDFLPDRSIRQLIVAARTEQGAALLGTYLTSFYSKKLTQAFGKYIPIDKNIASLSTGDIDAIEQFIHHFRIKPAGTKGYEKAEVMLGGVDTNELSSKTLESKKVKGLYFGGECVDVTGWLGGYNFQWAWASGFVIASNI